MLEGIPGCNHSPVKVQAVKENLVKDVYQVEEEIY